MSSQVNCACFDALHLGKYAGYRILYVADKPLELFLIIVRLRLPPYCGCACFLTSRTVQLRDGS